MLAENDRYRKFLGVDAWHKAGYTGKRGLTASGEDFNGTELHARQTYLIFKEFAPDREVIYLDASVNGGSAFADESIPAILARRVDTMWTSWQTAIDGSIYDDPMEPTTPFFSYFMSAGNDKDKNYNEHLNCKYIYGVGAYRLMVDTNEMAPEGYSSLTDEVDFCAPALVYVQTGTSSYPFSGTSCSAPILTAMAALVNDFFIDKTGKPLSSAMMYQFMEDHSTDIYTEGKDTKTGWGAVRLPDPAEIDIWKYWEVTDLSKEYTDAETIPAYAKDSVALLTDLGIMQGNAKGEFMPTVTVDRSQLAVAMANLYKKVSDIE